MTISVLNPGQETLIFAALFGFALAVGARRKRARNFFSPELTTELKGLAIAAVILAHVGYFMASDTRFLFPLSTLAGVGVNIFLFLSGYGLTVSALRQPASIWQFYRKRLGKIFVPFWMVVIILLILDTLILQRSYPVTTILHSLLGFFPAADLAGSFNAPLWYFTAIVFYYLLFPLLFLKKYPLFTAGLFLIASRWVLDQTLPVTPDVLNLYRLHTACFPLGIACAGIALWQKPLWLKGLTKRWEILLPIFKYIIRAGLIAALGALIAYTTIHSGVGEGYKIEQQASLITTAAVLLFFILLPLELGWLRWLGVYSFELYLFHWPLLYRYDVLYRFISPGWATFLYFLLFLALDWLIRQALVRAQQAIAVIGKPGNPGATAAK